MIKDQLKRRHLRIRKQISGNKEKPRLCVKRSNKHIYAILVDDLSGKVITTVSSANKDLVKEQPNPEQKGKGMPSGKTAVAYQVGSLLAQKAKSLGINLVVFDRAGYRYHGRVRAIAEGARKGGLKF
jgi:large subunit ribosomal protein L18